MEMPSRLRVSHIVPMPPTWLALQLDLLPAALLYASREAIVLMLCSKHRNKKRPAAMGRSFLLFC
jgi:hypothetical protein